MNLHSYNFSGLPLAPSFYAGSCHHFIMQNGFSRLNFASFFCTLIFWAYLNIKASRNLIFTCILEREVFLYPERLFFWVACSYLWDACLFDIRPENIRSFNPSSIHWWTAQNTQFHLWRLVVRWLTTELSTVHSIWCLLRSVNIDSDRDLDIVWLSWSHESDSE